MTRLSRSELQNRHCPCSSRGLTTTRGCSLEYRTRREVTQNHFLFPTLLALQTTMDPLRTNKKLVGLQMQGLFYVSPEASQNEKIFHYLCGLPPTGE